MTQILTQTHAAAEAESPACKLIAPFIPGYTLASADVNASARKAVLHLEPCFDRKDACPRCHARDDGDFICYGTRQITLRALLFANWDVTFVVTLRRFKCRRYGAVFEESCPLAYKYGDKTFRVTREVGGSVLRDLERNASVKDVAERYGISWNTARDIHKYWLQANTYFDLGDASVLAMDEFSIARGQTYATVVIDLPARRVIWVGTGKSNTDVKEFFKLCGPAGCDQIKAVAMDQNAGFASLVKRYCPHARVAYDLFHLLNTYNRNVLSAIRLRLCEDLGNNNDLAGRVRMKRARFLLLAKASTLCKEKRTTLAGLLRKYKDLGRAYLLYQQLYGVWAAKSREEAEQCWKGWVRFAKESKCAEAVEFARNQDKRYRDGIVNAATLHIGTSVLEGINNKIKVLKRIGYGFRDFVYFKLRVMHAFPGKPVQMSLAARVYA